MKFCGEIQYDRGYDENGNPTKDFWIHSDICHDCGSTNGSEMSEEYRKFLHDALDEWLDNANGTGAFWLGDPEYLLKEFKQED